MSSEEKRLHLHVTHAARRLLVVVLMIIMLQWCHMVSVDMTGMIHPFKNTKILHPRWPLVPLSADGRCRL